MYLGIFFQKFILFEWLFEKGFQTQIVKNKFSICKLYSEAKHFFESNSSIMAIKKCPKVFSSKNWHTTDQQKVSSFDKMGDVFFTISLGPD